MEYQTLILPRAERDLDKLSPDIRETIIKRVHWLSVNVENVIHHPLKGMPEDLKGLCKFRVGDYRILYWKNDAKRAIQIFRVRHRSDIYRKL
ncbi:MAG: type II toxin-antitoxin system RelE/ParE family toxin [Deltaproteobacteria bacterium]|nr:type II toxin-antitoxin system RelE/ParE family toxin [Deltaproteobacteria bacterium]